ncbi:hypothetical protein JW879_09990 [candidate division WOR-3 bacterium]|nr:hypothetical protein [candidate division WOR-3 bacterium]
MNKNYQTKSRNVRYGFKKTICLFFFLLLAVQGSCRVSAAEKPFEFEFNSFGFELGKGNDIHILAEIISLGFSYKMSEKLHIQLSTKAFEMFPSGFSGDYMFAGSSYPLYLSLIFKTKEYTSFYFAAGTSYWVEVYDMHYISSAIGYKLSFDDSGFFNISYFGCELQWINISQSSMPNDIISFNLIVGLGGVKKIFGTKT